MVKSSKMGKRCSATDAVKLKFIIKVFVFHLCMTLRAAALMKFIISISNQIGLSQ